MMNAYKNQVYAGVYRPTSGRLTTDWGPEALPLSELSNRLTENSYFCLGDGLKTYKEILSSETLAMLCPPQDDQLNHTSAKSLIQLFIQDSDQSRNPVWTELNPLYLRASEAEEKLQAGLLKPVEQL
ncbi:MAG: hypothetical protein R2827_01280 [Bdellovibrionales bacterium]